MAKIIKLDDLLSNKIAAGEVVERPASIVKELVENALDANSSHVLIEIEEGGLSSIRIVDNGEGIDAEDVETAFYRHATSKIKTDRDLFKIATLGFRGEALPSIASVSHLTLETGTGDGAGVKVTLEGGQIIDRTAAKTRQGTEIFVTNLFYNTPARLKYLKTVHTEAGNVSDIINRLALAHPNVAFDFFHNGKEVLKTNGNGDKRQVIAAIYGRNIAKNMIAIDETSLDYHLTGYLVKPEITRASRQYISIIVNGRYIRNYALARAIQEGYHTLLPIGRYPIVVLSIDMDPSLIDVNVHPSKLEVRLSKEEELSELITNAIKKAFQKEVLIPAAQLPKREKQQSEQVPLSFEENRQDVASPKWEVREQVEEQRHPSAQLTIEEDLRVEPITVEENVNQVEEANNVSSEPFRKVGEQQSVEPKPIHSRVPVLYPIGQMHGTYIVAQNDNGMYLIDQHAAQERIKYEYFREKVAEVEPQLQELLVPFTIECTNQEVTIIEEHKDKLQAVGVFLEAFGSQTYIVRSHPTWLPKGEEEETIREIVEQLIKLRRVDLAKFREDTAILMSCKASIKANRHLRQEEMFALLETLRKTSDPFTCPHGRPIIIHFSTYELEKMFKRVM
ncbi:DNA mismatch repair endonuclease MutL [Halalkalibacter urbisdiaboli]|uniref:DNA mismatch repair endonuclease MutL n=1 Tax=Halalkalibacter urbisdiaboli TaxID=1960589 RepID=UPI000B433D2A|nr:DNA mismatch repair endonuclease MutL [Halalkalibacter urbisdiaboli]